MIKLLLVALLFSSSFALELKLNSREAAKIAHKIWQNEGASKRKYLVWWNRGEEFASCGIGHFIWFSKNNSMWFFHAFPAMLDLYYKKRSKTAKMANTRYSLYMEQL